MTETTPTRRIRTIARAKSRSLRRRPAPGKRRSSPEEPVSKIARSDDGVVIHYQTVGHGAEVMILANGLGGRIHSWAPILKHFKGKYRFITWAYRGLFESGAPKLIRRLSIPNHAEDIRRVMDLEKVEKAIFVGWSMGVQVSLEFTTIYPERVDRLVLLNGTYGHALETGFQPFLRLPYINLLLHELIEWLLGRPDVVERMAAGARSKAVQDLVSTLIARIYRRPDLAPFMRQFIDDIFSPHHFSNFLRLFQELDAHSVYHRLRAIQHRALVAYGDLDFLTPGYQSRDMIRKMPNAEGFHVRTATHFLLLEYPHRLLPRMEAFLTD